MYGTRGSQQEVFNLARVEGKKGSETVSEEAPWDERLHNGEWMLTRQTCFEDIILGMWDVRSCWEGGTKQSNLLEQWQHRWSMGWR